MTEIALKSLFEQWLEIELETGRQLKDILADLNTACGTHYKHNWPSVMASRGYSMERAPAAVRVYMARRVLPAVLDAHGVVFDDKLVSDLLRCLT
ncbi:hypothetical protein ACPRNU_22475 [Chromobacterium vaccinii]|uniref:hypothetical protein n=1 Tax=Chromobacterium vaccinii TaxID=1108595 RepID=UPI003C76B72C